MYMHKDLVSCARKYYVPMHRNWAYMWCIWVHNYTELNSCAWTVLWPQGPAEKRIRVEALQPHENGSGAGTHIVHREHPHTQRVSQPHEGNTERMELSPTCRRHQLRVHRGNRHNKLLTESPYPMQQLETPSMQILGIKYISPMGISNPWGNLIQGANLIRRVGKMRSILRHSGSLIVVGFPFSVVGLGEVSNH